MVNIDSRLASELDPDQFYLIFNIVSYMGLNKFCFPSNSKLAEKTGFSPRKVQRVKSDLVQKGMIEVFQRFREDGSQTSNLYKLKTSMISVFVTAKEMSEISAENAELINLASVVTPPHVTTDAPPHVTTDAPPTSPLTPLEVLEDISIIRNEFTNNMREGDFEKNQDKNLGPFAKMANGEKSTGSFLQPTIDEVGSIIEELNKKTFRSGQKNAFKLDGKNANLIYKCCERHSWLVSDFFAVIEYKVAEWGQNATMRKFLRPETLFSSEHADDYLAEAKAWIKVQEEKSQKKQARFGVLPLYQGSDYNVKPDF